MSETLDNTFKELLGRQPTDNERQRLYQVRDALGLKNNDALWLVLIALQHHLTLYEKMPDSIIEAGKKMRADVKATAEAEASAAMKQARAQLSKAVATASQKVAQQVAGKVKTQWICGCFIVVTGFLLGAGWLGYQVGEKNGWARGYEETVHEEVVVKWAVTTEGKLAYALAHAGSGNIERLAGCTGAGWHREKYEDGYACFAGGKEGANHVAWWVP